MQPACYKEFYWNGDCEDITGYKPGGFHPVHLGDMFSKLPDSTLPRYRVMHKLGFGAFSTVWLARDLSEAHKIALKINVARISDNNESRILQWLKTQPFTHPGREHILTLRDSFFIHGPNGKHEVLVTDVVLPLHQFELGNVLKDHSKRICFQCLMGIAYLQEHNVSHGDLHLGNLAICIPGIESQTMDDFMDYFRNPDCMPVVTRDPSKDTKFLPKYLVLPISILDIYFDIFESTPGHAICVKIMDFGNAFRPTDNRPPPCTLLKIRPPEVELNRQLGGIIDDEYGLKSDIWSLGCTFSVT